jgi:Immunoglobulin domain/Bacterial Ig domain
MFHPDRQSAKKPPGLSVLGPGLWPSNFGVFAVALFLLAAIANWGTAATVTLNPVADAYIRQFDPDRTLGDYGSEPSLVSGALGSRAQFEVRRALLRFDLSQIPAGAVVSSATLKITVVMVPMTPNNSTFDIRRVLQLWTEGGVSWNSRLGAGTPWQVPGATGSADAISTPSSFVAVGSANFTEYTFSSMAGLVADVQGWINNPSSNFGWLLISEDEVTPQTARRFGAREDPVHPPVLTVNYSLPSLGVTIQPPSQDVLEGSSVTFTANATGTPPFSYQWFFNANPVAGETNSTLVLNNVQTNQSGNYSVTVSNQTGTATSAPAVLTVSPLVSGLPLVTITSPTNGAKFPAGVNVLIAANASESNGVITQVEFFLSTNSIGIVTNSPFQLTLANAAPSNYLVTARATDDQGKVGVSPGVAFSVIEPPTVTISAPIGAARFAIGTNVPVTASVASKGASIVRVDFFASVEGLEATNIGSVVTSPYTLNWLPAGPGDFTLTATALDELGQSGQSTGVVVRLFIPELILPTVAITDGPPNFARVTESPITLGGTANDNIGVDHVEFSVVSGPLLQNIGPFVPAEGTENWIAQVALQPGKNAVRVRSVDLANNKSAVLTRFYTFFAQAPLTVVINGDGAVNPNLDGRDLELGKVYSVTARPGAGQIFSRWEISTNTDLSLTNNVIFSNRATLSFQMKPNLVLVADFEANPFPALAGAYAGLFFDANTNRFRPENAGLFALQLGNNGAFSGRIVIEGVSHRFGGSFDLSGKAQVGIIRRALPPVSLALQLDVTGASGTITGAVTTASEANTLTSSLLANRRANPPLASGRRDFSLVDDAGEQIVSAASFTDAIGHVEIRGVLQAGPVFNLGTSMGSEGSVPFYISLNRGSEVITGWLQFGSDSSVGGELFWVSPSLAGVSLLNVVAQ